MSDDLVEIAGRVQRLERDNRRLKLGAGALVAVLVTLPLVAAVLPPQNPFRQQQEVIEARLFRVLDEQGELRAALSEGGLSFYDEQENEGARLRADGLSFFDEEQGTTRVALGEIGLVFADEQGTVRAHLGADSLGFVDEQEAIRLQLGRVTVVTERTKAETTYPAALVLFDEEGNVIERLPR